MRVFIPIFFVTKNTTFRFPTQEEFIHDDKFVAKNKPEKHYEHYEHTIHSLVNK